MQELLELLLGGDILGLVLSFCSISDFKSLSLSCKSIYETHFTDPNSSAFTEWLLQIIAKSCEKKLATPSAITTTSTTTTTTTTSHREMWFEIEKFRPYVWKQLTRRRLIPKGTTLDQISSLNCLQVISFMNNNWLEMKLLFFSSDFYTFQASSRFQNVNGILSANHLGQVDNLHSTMMENEGITIEGWFNLAESFNPGSKSDYIFYLKNDSNSHGIGFITKPNSNALAFRVGSRETKPHPTRPYEWNHYAGVYSFKHDLLQFYVNGELVGYEDSIAQHDEQLDFKANGMELVVAAQHNGCGSIRGEFTDLRVWNNARSQKQIKQSMGRRIFVYHFENTQDMNYLVFNCYPDPKMDEEQTIFNKSPNFRYRTKFFNLHANIEYLGGPIQSRLFHKSLTTAKFKI